MEIEIISKESIKPSSPTPSHLKTFNLSVLDQIVITPYVALILHYHNHNDNILQALERSISLKKSLSKTLTLFYPLAGTIKNDLEIDCNDVGAYYALALVRGRLDDFLDRPDHRLINRFLPVDPNGGMASSGVGDRVTNVQVNVFECGGIAVGLCVSHKVVDGAAVSTFLKKWAAFMKCGGKEVVDPNLFTSSDLFPAKDLWLRDVSRVMWKSYVKKGISSMKRFRFDSGSIAKLKAETGTRGVIQNPTRVEVVSALIWKCAMAASKQVRGSVKPSRLTHAVDLRRKLESQDLMGNVLWVATAVLYDPKPDPTLDNLAKKVHESISKVDVEFVKKIQGEKVYVALQESHKEMVENGPKGGSDSYMFTSWCKMGFDEIDFGWGDPSWVTGMDRDGNPVFVNFVTLIDTKNGEGIEAWVTLEKEEMKILERNPELLAFASVDPSPLPK